MSTSPNHTPNNKKSNKRLPMIVDIAIDDSGKQLYQVHESSRYVRKEMPKSTNFNSAGLISEYEEEKTPIRKILGTISPSTLNQKKISDDDNSEESHISDMDNASKSYTVNNLFNDDLELDSTNYLSQNSMRFNPQAGSSSTVQPPDFSATVNSNASSTDIWSQDVEEAFEEVLSIIPKNGLSKIKISGRSCGRNELISDYIFTKTGKYRTRKQVSSHIQVIKNLGQKRHIIKLINDGPSFNSKEEQEENNRRFEEIFSKINLDKSLGFRKSSKRNLMDANFETSVLAPKPKRRSEPSYPFSPNKSHFLVNNFFMSIYDTSYANPIFLTVQKNDDNIMNLQLKRDANIANRFPSLSDFRSLDTPIFHNFVKINYPDKLPFNYSLQSSLKTNWILKDTGNPSANLSIFTVVYSYGKEVFKVNDTNIKSNENIPFLIKFWEYLLGHEILETPVKQEDGMKLEGFNLKGLTIKQIVYDCSSIKMHNSFKVPKLTIRQIILWEFAKVDDPKDAITTTTKLLLSDDASPLSGMSSTIPQVVNYSQPQYYPQPVSTAAPTTSNTFVSNPTIVSSASTVDQNFMRGIDASPLVMQKKFQPLDQQPDTGHLSYATAQGQPRGAKQELPLHSNPEQVELPRVGHQVSEFDIHGTVLQPQSNFVSMPPPAPQQYQPSQQHMTQSNVTGAAQAAGVSQFPPFDYMNPEYQIQGFLYSDNNYVVNNSSNTNNTEY